MFKTVSQVLQIVFSLGLVGLVLVQSKGKGLSNAFGVSFGIYRSRRGLEKVVFIGTIVLSVLLVLNSVLLLAIS